MISEFLLNALIRDSYGHVGNAAMAQLGNYVGAVPPTQERWIQSSPPSNNQQDYSEDTTGSDRNNAQGGSANLPKDQPLLASGVQPKSLVFEPETKPGDSIATLVNDCTISAEDTSSIWDDTAW